MEASAAPGTRSLMHKDTFTWHFRNTAFPHQTLLCYEVGLPDGDSRVLPDQEKGFLCNKARRAHPPEPGCHAELCFWELVRSWELDKELHYRVTCFISWSPCANCAQKLAQFLKENSHVSLCIFASRIYSLSGYEAGLRTLQAAGAQIAIMTSKEFEYCWETFVDHQRRPFLPWDGLDDVSRNLSLELQGILQ